MTVIYKKISTSTVRNKHIPSASTPDKAQATNIINTFVTLFKQKHLS